MMKTFTRNKYLGLAGLSILCLPLISIAGLPAPATPELVDTENVTVFESGGPATAASMNATIQELMRVIDNNANVLQQLQDQVAVLEAQASNASVAGRTYKLAGVGMFFENLEDGNQTSTNERFHDNQITVTFNNDGTYTGSFSYRERYVWLSIISDGIDTDVSNGWDDLVDEGGAFSGNYSQTGNTVVTSTEGMTFTVSKNGQSIMYYDRDGEAGWETALMIGVETTN